VSDDIAVIAGRDTFAYTGSHPWHGKGKQIPGVMTVEEAILFGGLDWDVLLSPIQMSDLEMTPLKTHKATYRQEGDRKIPLGIVGSKYQVVQNAEAFDFFNHAIEKNAACLETVGALGNGERVFAMARVPSIMEVTPGDPVEQFILLCTSHDGSMNIQAMFTAVRVVCQNTLDAAVKGAAHMVKIRHSKNAKKKIAEAYKVMAASDKYWNKLREAYRAMAMRDMSRLDVMTLLEELFPGKTQKAPAEAANADENFFDSLEEDEDGPVIVSARTANNRAKILRLFESEAIGADKAGKTAWGLYNAMTQYIDYERSLKNDSNRWEATALGSGVALRQKAFDVIMKGV
jgi:phage/plasmid-like protein (TIGR03299 family)